ncbi:MAG: hypothetical protein AB7T31_04990 [Gemmatimonadales bacterium]
MSHVDEGALHAYLDGALDEYPAAEARRVREHVETCAVCTERLAEERRIRDEARGILDLAAPRVEVPTFEELRAYVRAGQSQRRALGRLHKMGWAASVVLALGTGWFLRGGRVDPMPAFRDQERAAAPTRTAPPADVAETQAPQPAVTPQPAPLQELERDRSVDAPAPAAVGAEPPPPVAARERAAADAPSLAGAARAEVAQALGAQAAGAPASVPEPDLPADATVADARGALDDTSGGAALGFGDAVAAGLSGQRQVSDELVQQRLDSAARAAESRRRIAADQAVTSALDAAPAAPALQRPSAANEVEKRDDDETGTSLVVPGLEVLDVQPVSEGTAFAGVRAYQRLANGDTLEVVHLPEGIDPQLLPPLPVGRNQLTRQTPEGWLVMRAPVSLLDLEQLLERLEAGR